MFSVCIAFIDCHSWWRQRADTLCSCNSFLFLIVYFSLNHCLWCFVLWLRVRGEILCISLKPRVCVFALIRFGLIRSSSETLLIPCYFHFTNPVLSISPFYYFSVFAKTAHEVSDLNQTIKVECVRAKQMKKSHAMHIEGNLSRKQKTLFISV